MKTIKVKDIMTPEPFIVPPTMVVREAAKRMKDIDCGVLPVGDANKVLGMVTDRDITLRVTAEGKDPAKTQVQDVMTKKVHICDEDDDIEDAAEKMRKYDVARLVVTKGKKATGIVTMVELLRNTGSRRKGDKVLHELVKPQGCSTQKSKKMAGCCD
jgi:CBS domain-containing protein